jgi:L-histidine N-alpha-methyltransferase
MDIGLRAREPHTVPVPALDLDVPLEAGDTLRVEISSKFRRDRFEREAEECGLAVESWSTDEAGDFALALLRAV